jgi:hypothetical protein
MFAGQQGRKMANRETTTTKRSASLTVWWVM